MLDMLGYCCISNDVKSSFRIFRQFYLCRFHCSLIIIERQNEEEEEGEDEEFYRIYCIVFLCLFLLVDRQHKRGHIQIGAHCAENRCTFLSFFIIYLFILFEMENKERKK